MLTNRSYIKHLIECKCFLPQFKNRNPPIFHKFLVFSEIDENGEIVPTYAKCNNCDVIHKVTEVFESSIVRRETISMLPKIEELKTNIPSWCSTLLEEYKCELPLWQEAKFIFENEDWGKSIILSKETVDSTTSGKYLLILGQNLYKVDNFMVEA